MCFRIRIRVGEPPGLGHMAFHIGPCSGGRGSPPTWMLSGKLQAADEKKQSDVFNFYYFFALFGILCHFFASSLTFWMCVFFFFNIVNKIPHIYRHFLFKIRSQYYTRFFLFWLCTEVQKKSTFVPFIPDVTCVASPKKGFPPLFFFFFRFNTHTPSWPHVHPICPITITYAAFFL